MNLFALKLLHVGVYKNTNDSNFLLYKGQTVAPKGHMSPSGFIQPNRYMNGVLKLLHVGVYKNTNDSNFLLYREPRQ